MVELIVVGVVMTIGIVVLSVVLAVGLVGADVRWAKGLVVLCVNVGGVVHRANGLVVVFPV